MAYVDANARAIIAVDSSLDIPPDTIPAVVLNTTDGTYKVNERGLRKSIRLESLERHSPVGPPVRYAVVCRVFHYIYVFGLRIYQTPSPVWMYGEDWPNNGEIDIFEGWNDNVKNRATLHTTANCSHDPTGNQTGKVIQETCDYSVNYNAGCGVEDSNPDSFGQRLNQLGGGVFAAMYTHSEISVWRWARNFVPHGIHDDFPQPETWGIPIATWKTGQYCDLRSKFGPQNLVFTITTCGDADKNTYSQGQCPGTCFEQINLSLIDVFGTCF
ncbi:hypothetical protein O181_034348 [Austropuccinia psidii MF-1]|uniref:GH16 domain-containing protein n=1 Tax=Austropuccinia psidii MF-1 TaxID=1389203 RepID=A0A9Q3H795_9BASI|nr:hypothetical protein [Austropuccinia psidii MF-1]